MYLRSRTEHAHSFLYVFRLLIYLGLTSYALAQESKVERQLMNDGADVWLGKWSAAASYKQSIDVFRWHFRVLRRCGEYRVATHTSGPEKVEVLNINANELEFLFHDSLGTHITISLVNRNTFSGTVVQPNNAGLPRGRVDGQKIEAANVQAADNQNCKENTPTQQDQPKIAQNEVAESEDCAPITHDITVGRAPFKLALAFDQPLLPQNDRSPAKANTPAYCHYRGYKIASSKIEMATLGGTSLAVSYAIPLSEMSVSLSKKKNQDDPGQTYRHIWISWQGRSSEAVFERWGLNFYVVQMQLALDVKNTGELSVVRGIAALQAEVVNDIHLGGPLYLSGSGRTALHYDWHVGDLSWRDGEWRFDALQGLELQVRRHGTMPLAKSRLNIERDGKASAQMFLASVQSFSLCGLELTLTQSDLRASADFARGKIELTRGALSGIARTSGFIDSETNFRLIWRDGQLRFNADNNAQIGGQSCPDETIAGQVMGG